MAVYYASDQYRILGRYLRGDEVKAWIRNDKRAGKGPHGHRRPSDRDLPSPASVLTISAPNILLSASLNSFLLGLGIYLAYVWIRNLDAAASKNGSRAVFIIYVVSLTSCYGIYKLSRVVVARQSYTSDIDIGPSSWAKVAASKRGEIDIQGTLQANGKEITHIMPMRALSQDDGASRSHPIPPSSMGQDSLSTGNAIEVELIRALKEAAQLRRGSAAADERIAQLYERLSQR
jgi:hypothetical protein